MLNHIISVLLCITKHSLTKKKFLGEHFEPPFQTIVQYEGKILPDGQVVFDFPAKLNINYMLHCDGGTPIFTDGVNVSNLERVELVLFET